MTEGGAFYESAVKHSQLQCDTVSLGGPAYLEAGIEEVLNHTVTLSDGTPMVEQWHIHNYAPSAVEFYTY